jgi:excisionase family DNA binding protein
MDAQTSVLRRYEVVPVQTSNPANEPAVDRVLTVLEASYYLNVTPKWVYDHVENGELPCRRAGRMIRFIQSDLDEWLSSHCLGVADGADHDGTPLMSGADLQAHLGVSRSWIYEARRSKHLPHYKLGGLLRFSRPMVNAWFCASTSDIAHLFRREVA